MPNPNASQPSGLNGPAPAAVASASATGPAQSEQPPAVPRPAPQVSVPRSRIWMQRLLVLLFVFVCAAAGVLLVILPWTTEWTDNILLLRYPELRSVITNGFFRGLCSGLGLLDIWIGFSEAIHYHEDRLP